MTKREITHLSSASEYVSQCPTPGTQLIETAAASCVSQLGTPPLYQQKQSVTYHNTTMTMLHFGWFLCTHIHL